MSDAMERSCGSCAYSRVIAGRYIACEKCVNYSMHKFPEEVELGAIPFAEQIREALPKDKDPLKFSLDKLIDDHWNYVEDTLNAHGCSDREIEIAGHHYRTAAFHFWKHCVEHYNIKESDDD